MQFTKQQSVENWMGAPSSSDSTAGFAEERTWGRGKAYLRA